MSLRRQAELQLENGNVDCVVFNGRNNISGITDLSFEKRNSNNGSKKVVSLYFKSDREGTRAYKATAIAIADFPGVDLQFTPHFGQSRITLEWESFWQTLNEGHMLGKSSTLSPILLPLFESESTGSILENDKTNV